jgi:hypothetical protein
LHWVILLKKTHNRTLLFGSIHSSRVAIMTTETSLWTCACVCYLHYHEAGLCCYLVIQIENLFHPLQLFYFHLCPIYWLSLVTCRQPSISGIFHEGIRGTTE